MPLYVFLSLDYFEYFQLTSSSSEFMSVAQEEVLCENQLATSMPRGRVLCLRCGTMEMPQPEE